MIHIAYIVRQPAFKDKKFEDFVVFTEPQIYLFSKL